ncbi:hypothetical protein EDC04DRAFT_2791076 [Pisolithus marmoratus]|nr:hypothetical protein EDC04DRAFT_2791076 [Pisolithus marmoratus]
MVYAMLIKKVCTSDAAISLVAITLLPTATTRRAFCGSLTSLDPGIHERLQRLGYQKIFLEVPHHGGPSSLQQKGIRTFTLKKTSWPAAMEDFVLQSAFAA